MQSLGKVFIVVDRSKKLPILRTSEEDSIPPKRGSENISVIINEVQLLLAEKRTSLATMRTGIAVFALPLSVVSVLIATSKYYVISNVLNLLLPLLFICAALVVLGSYLIIRAIVRIHRYDQMIRSIKRRHSQIAEFID